MRISHRLAVARGDEPAELVLRNGRLINVFSGTIESADLAVAGEQIVGIGPGYAGGTEIDLDGAFVAPGLIDAHVHIESSLSIPPNFAAAVVPRGVTTVITDPHEIANVAGLAGVRFMYAAARNLPLNVVIMAPSCVPASHMETNGGPLTVGDLRTLRQEGIVHGLAEVMNFPGTVYGEPDVLAKLAAFADRPRDGHAPALTGTLLNAYAVAGIGSEHECTTVEEAAEKLARGFYVFIREATNARNLHTLLPLVTEANSRRIAFCTDDRVPGDLLRQGSIDYMVREAIAYGINPVTAFRLGTLNSVEWFGLRDRGALAPGRRADFWTFADLSAPHADMVFHGGRLVARSGKLEDEIELPEAEIPAAVGSSVKIDWSVVDLRIPARGAHIRAIGTVRDQLVTEERILPARIENGLAVADPEADLVKMAVIDRHSGQSRVGLGFLEGFGLRRGALAGTVAHDHHNLVIIGADDASMRAAGQAVTEMGGGLSVSNGAEIVASLPLPVAGLMSARPIHEVAAVYDTLIDAAHTLGVELHDPFMAMSFMALEVIPALKLTDHGLVDVNHFELVDLFIEAKREAHV